MSPEIGSLFEYAAAMRSYPNAPGYRATDTSRAAAKAVEPKAGTLQAEVLRVLREHGPLATFEMPRLCDATYRSLQPRTSELRRLGLIRDTGQRREDPETRKMAIVWSIV